MASAPLPHPPAEDDDRLPLGRRVPPVSVASPAQLRVDAGRPVRWYEPGLAETLRLMGWRVVYFAPAAAMLGGLAVALPLVPGWVALNLLAYWKVLLVAVALPTGAALSVAARAVRNRREPFCIHCGYDLTGMPDDHRCPECGAHYTHAMIDEYRRDPRWFVQRFNQRGAVPPPDAPFAAGPVPAKPPGRRRSRDGT